ncbi:MULTISPECIES: AAA family ATPase [unclassified Novosphingobium]|uniref:AAA family ATPase n=1 Tax=unclassified Novosphingobium TaxID=2644732 RepID=UPI00146E097B|nr:MULTISPECIES: AAA family ATPase [unclassified Novosphingobium]NMN07645.1 energy-coupling factor transporter ATP-binding protein EcfA2 [Novosphingobium sp. SG919]NMN89953.1 energy-coupling factor transporter ATP-binding protein EcfA2 [Novosphingobium sp. SG916]
MKLKTAHIQNYRSIRDTGVFEIEAAKTILVGPNEAGKTAVLQALQQINPPKGIKRFDALRDYPRAKYNDISTKKVDPKNVPVATVTFTLDEDDLAALPESMRGITGYSFTRYIANNASHFLIGAPALPTVGAIRKDAVRLAAHVDGRTPVAEGAAPSTVQAESLNSLLQEWRDENVLSNELSSALKQWVDRLVAHADDSEDVRIERLLAAFSIAGDRSAALEALDKRIPVFVLFSNYFRVRPLIHLGLLADRLDSNILDDEQYDYGNKCLLQLLGFTARDLSDLGKAPEPPANQPQALQAFRDQLDKRKYQLNAASVQLTNEIRSVWKPSSTRPEADRLRLDADGQYLKVVVEDELGVEIELDQRSEGFQWLVSFFVVFFAEAADKHENAILLLDEPGMSLHALKQREFRETITKLAAKNQTIYTTHSPFLVGPNELDYVRVVELNDRNVGTKVHTTITSSDPAALLPLQEALGYDLAQSLFAQERNLVLEGLTDEWYLEGVAGLLADSGEVKLNDKIALVTADSAGKVVYFATILHAHKLKVAALLDSDNAGDAAAKQDTLVHKLGQKSILRTKDYASGVAKAEIEDLLRDTLPIIARDQLGWDIVDQAAQQSGRPLVDIFSGVTGFSKYKLAKAFLRWTRDNNASSLSRTERSAWTKLITAINAALK